jgi:hypothetical protein
MKQDEIIDMVVQISGCDKPKDDSPALKIFIAFAKLVEAKEREACAKVCDEVGEHPSLQPRHCAESIRARGQA